MAATTPTSASTSATSGHGNHGKASQAAEVIAPVVLFVSGQYHYDIRTAIERLCHDLSTSSDDIRRDAGIPDDTWNAYRDEIDRDAAEKAAALAREEQAELAAAQAAEDAKRAARGGPRRGGGNDEKKEKKLSSSVSTASSGDTPVRPKSSSKTGAVDHDGKTPSKSSKSTNSTGGAKKGSKAAAAKPEVLPLITEIKISGCKMAASSIRALCALIPRCRAITTLSFWNAGITDEGLRLLADCLPTTSVQRLSIEFNPVDASSPSPSSAASPNLASPSLTVSGGGGHDIKSARGTASDSKREDNNAAAAAAANMTVTDNVWSLFVPSGSTPLQMLTLRSNHLADDSTIAVVTALRDNRTIAALNLWDNHITDASIPAIVDTLVCNRTLVSLNLSSNHITDTGAIALAAAFQAQGIDKEQMKNAKRDGMRVTQVKTRVFRDANNTLRYINLDSNRLTDTAGVVWCNIITNHGGVILLDEKDDTTVTPTKSAAGSASHSRRASGTNAAGAPSSSPTAASAAAAAAGTLSVDSKITSSPPTSARANRLDAKDVTSSERKTVSRAGGVADSKRNGGKGNAAAAAAATTAATGEVVKPRTFGGAISIMDKIEKPKKDSDKAAAAAAAAAKKAEKVNAAERDISFNGMKHALERINMAYNAFTDDVQQRLLQDARVTLGSHVVKRVPPVDPNAPVIEATNETVKPSTRGASRAAATRSKSPAVTKRGVSTERPTTTPAAVAV